MFKIVVLFLLLVSCEYQHGAVQMPNTRVESFSSSNEQRLESIYSKFEEYRDSFSHARNIEPVEAIALRDLLFLDVREPREVVVSKIKNALTLEEFNVNKERYRSKQIVVYCTIGYRSGLISQKLLLEGFDSYNLLGGVLLWSHFGYDFYREGSQTKEVHIYSAEWAFLHSSYQAIF